MPTCWQYGVVLHCSSLTLVTCCPAISHKGFRFWGRLQRSPPHGGGFMENNSWEVLSNCRHTVLKTLHSAFSNYHLYFTQNSEEFYMNIKCIVHARWVQSFHVNFAWMIHLGLRTIVVTIGSWCQCVSSLKSYQQPQIWLVFSQHQSQYGWTQNSIYSVCLYLI